MHSPVPSRSPLFILMSVVKVFHANSCPPVSRESLWLVLQSPVKSSVHTHIGSGSLPCVLLAKEIFNWSSCRHIYFSNESLPLSPLSFSAYSCQRWKYYLPTHVSSKRLLCLLMSSVEVFHAYFCHKWKSSMCKHVVSRSLPYILLSAEEVYDSCSFQQWRTSICSHFSSGSYLCIPLSAIGVSHTYSCGSLPCELIINGYNP